MCTGVVSALTPMAVSQAPSNFTPFLLVLKGTRHVPISQRWHLLSSLPQMLLIWVSLWMTPSSLLEPLFQITFLIPLLAALLASATPTPTLSVFCPHPMHRLVTVMLTSQRYSRWKEAQLQMAGLQTGEGKGQRTEGRAFLLTER